MHRARHRTIKVLVGVSALITNCPSWQLPQSSAWGLKITGMLGYKSYKSAFKHIEWMSIKFNWSYLHKGGEGLNL